VTELRLAYGFRLWGSDVGRRLAEAWEAAFRVSPDTTKAYSMAVKARLTGGSLKTQIPPRDKRRAGRAPHDSAAGTKGAQS
jgi:hypothetical protein